MGIGLIALAFFAFYGIHFTLNEVSLIPEYISALLMLMGLLALRQKIKEKFIDYAIIATSGFFMISFVRSFYASEWLILTMYMVQFAMDYFVLVGIKNISVGYPDLLKYQKHIKIFLLMMFVLSIPFVNVFIMLVMNIFVYVLLAYLLYKSCCITYHLYKINLYLMENRLTVLPKKEIARTKKNITVAIISIMVSLLGITYLAEPIMYHLEDRSQNIRYANYHYRGDDLIIEYLSIFDEDAGISTGVYPDIYLNEDLCKPGNLIEIRVDGKSNIEKSELVIDEDDHHYPGFCKLVFDYNYLFDYQQLDQMLDHQYQPDFTITLYDHRDYMIKSITDKLSLVKSDTYSYQDHEIEIRNLEVADGKMLKEPDVHFKKGKYTSLQVYLLQGNQEIQLNCYHEITHNYASGSYNSLVLEPATVIKLKLVLDDTNGKTTTKVYDLRLEK